ncbi:MAG: hypothetical protein ACK40O_04735 [Allosphingosinicella sp.]
MKRTTCLAAAAALTALAAPAGAAVPTRGETQAAAPSPADAMRAMVEELRTEVLRPGETIQGWDVGGGDPEAALRAKGADRFYFLESEGGKRNVGIVTERRITDFAPARWRVLDSYGSPVAYAENPSVGFTALGTRHFIGMRQDGYRENGIDCSRKFTHALLFEDPEAPADDTDTQSAIGLFRIAIMAMEGQTICARSDGDAEAGWNVRYLLPDGRALPVMNDPPTHLAIVPAAPVDTLVRSAPPAPAAE